LATTASNNLTNYYTKTDSYNKTEVDNLIAGAGGGLYEKDSNDNVKQNTDTNIYTGSNSVFLTPNGNQYNQYLDKSNSIVLGKNAYTTGNNSAAIGT
jgi:hypothetical protein